MPGKIDIFDTTLRDGEQSSNTKITVKDKLHIAHALKDLGVDIIEAGFPASSPKDYEAVHTISSEIKNTTICALSRVITADIEACLRALKNADKSRIHTGIGVSDIHISSKFRDPKYGKTLVDKKETILRLSYDAVSFAAQYVDEVEFYAEDATRADRKYLDLIIDTVINAGATIINIPDTTGIAIPEEYGSFIKSIKQKLPDTVKVSIHCHNDLGMAAANTLAGIKNGADQCEGTILGIGERAGNCALEEVIMCLETRKKYFNVSHTINTKKIYSTCLQVSDIFNVPIHEHKAIVGRKAFSHSSGIHVDGFLKNRDTYEIINPTDVGITASEIILTARTGRKGLRHKLEKNGIRMNNNDLDIIYTKFIKLADEKSVITNTDLLKLITCK
jgi:2-isopropylmalate synthase